MGRSDQFRRRRFQTGARIFLLRTARYWIEEFHFDGYRYDATHAIQDASQEHILAAVNRTARQAAGERSVYLVAENAVGEARTVWPAREGGFDMDAVWNDDFHHAARVRVTGNNAGYYSDYTGSPEELAAALKHGFIYQGQWAVWTHHAPRHADHGITRHGICEFHSKPRPNIKFPDGAAYSRTHKPWPLPCHHGAMAFGAADPVVFFKGRNLPPRSHFYTSPITLETWRKPFAGGERNSLLNFLPPARRKLAAIWRTPATLQPCSAR